MQDEYFISLVSWLEKKTLAALLDCTEDQSNGKFPTVIVTWHLSTLKFLSNYTGGKILLVDWHLTW